MKWINLKYLRGEIRVSNVVMILDVNWLNTTQNNIFRYFYAKSTQSWDEYAGIHQSMHCFFAYQISVKKENVFDDYLFLNALHLSIIESFINIQNIRW